MIVAENKRFVFASTAAVIGEPDIFPSPENISIPMQTSLYGASKMSCENYISAYSNCFNIEAYVFRFVSLLGPRYPHGHVIDFVRKLQKDSSKLNILGNGEAKKSYLHIFDCIKAIELVSEIKRPAKDFERKYKVFNLGFDGYIQVKDSAILIASAMNLKPQFIYEDQKRGWIGDNLFVHLDITEITNMGWIPKFSIEESISITVNCY